MKPGELGSNITKSNSYELFMHKDFKTVIAPTGDLVLLGLGELILAYEHLTTWALPIKAGQLSQ